MSKIHTVMKSVLSHLTPSKGFSFKEDAPTNPGGVNLFMTKTKTGSGGNKMMERMPKPKTSGKKLTT